MRRFSLLIFTVGFIFATHAAARAQTTYQMQRIAQRGDKVGSAQIKSTGSFFVGSLTDNGHLVFDTESAAGGELLVQYADGKLTPIIAAGGSAPSGKWPGNMLLYPPVSMNQAGNLVFAAPVQTTSAAIGTYTLASPADPIRVLALSGMPVASGMVYVKGGGPSPVINNPGDVVFTAQVSIPARNIFGGAILLRGRDGKLQTVAMFNQTLPGGIVTWVASPVLDDAGRVVFLAAWQGNEIGDAFLWENGTITPVLRQPVKAPVGKLMLGFVGAWPNNQNRNILLDAHFYALTRHYFSLFLSVDGAPVPVAVPDQPMPGGGNYQSAQVGGVSFANERGEHAFMAVLSDGSTAAYRMDAGGKLSLILKSGMMTPWGKVTSVGEGSAISYGTGLGEGAAGSQGIAINSQGQVVLPVKIGSGPDALLLLTPAAP